jgi:hypothetical protein
MQPLGCRAEASKLGHMNEGPQLTQLHRYSLMAKLEPVPIHMGISPPGQSGIGLRGNSAAQ